MNQPKLIDQLRSAIRLRNYSPRTEEAYWHWIKKFILFHNKRHPNDMGEPEITAFLSHLAVDRKVTASTQNQALSALLFLYKEVLKRPLEWMDNIQRAKKPSRLPLVFTKEEAQSILRNLEGTKWLMASLLFGVLGSEFWVYGSGISGFTFQIYIVEPRTLNLEPKTGNLTPYISCLFVSALCMVTSSAYSKSDPTGTPIAMRVTRIPSGLSNRER
jgi:hypothetical protein